MCLLSSSYTWSVSPLLLTEATSRAVKPSWRDIEDRENKREGGKNSGRKGRREREGDYEVEREGGTEEDHVKMLRE